MKHIEQHKGKQCAAYGRGKNPQACVEAALTNSGSRNTVHPVDCEMQLVFGARVAEFKKWQRGAGIPNDGRAIYDCSTEGGRTN